MFRGFRLERARGFTIRLEIANCKLILRLPDFRPGRIVEIDLRLIRDFATERPLSSCAGERLKNEISRVWIAALVILGSDKY